MTKTEFVQQYVATHSNTEVGIEYSIKEAEEAWDVLTKLGYGDKRVYDDEDGDWF